MSHQDQEYTESGQPIYRHTERKHDFQLAEGNEESIERIRNHIEKYIGRVDNVFHELISDLVHIDVFMVAPTPERNYYSLITSGMSELPMTVPEGAESYSYAELMICLPPTWNVSQEGFQKEENYWPVRWLKTMARLPHEYDTWLYAGHTIPNGDPAESYTNNTKLSGMMLAIPTLVDDVESFFSMPCSEDKVVHFFSLLPLYQEEMDFKLKKGVEDLFEKLEQAGVNEIVNIKRKNVCKKSFWIF
ncbi:suppressor of fused domain protein [Paenibacillus agilis]|uniref:Suppressor of fused domain protein n=1 Tax=Paenibacillus agilis TaxID=3020863 RepID=A0A559J2K0_9BACL|nr:suppressor of fused domain protein [Paenibacillus agilis]TVX94056.1 suppressor of fused domain protein [Paenibacillus agilis]